MDAFKSRRSDERGLELEDVPSDCGPSWGSFGGAVEYSELVLKADPKTGGGLVTFPMSGSHRSILSEEAHSDDGTLSC